MFSDFKYVTVNYISMPNILSTHKEVQEMLNFCDVDRGESRLNIPLPALFYCKGKSRE